MKNKLMRSFYFNRKLGIIVCFLSIISIFAVFTFYKQDFTNEYTDKNINPQSSAVPTAPGPLLESTWAVNTYSSVTALFIGFTNSTGHLGYSYVFDSNSGTEPNGWINMWVNSSYHTSLTTGTYYLHVKANNTDGCSATTHYGPWYVDQALPTNPSSGSSSSHSDATWSNNASITYSWSGAGDTGGSGLKGYGIRVETYDPGEFSSFTTSATSYITVVPISGQYKVYVRSQDNVGNWASSRFASSQTYYIDIDNPGTPTISTRNVTSDWYNYQLHANVSWIAPSDTGGSGIDGYSYSFTQNSGDIPDDTKDIEETQLYAISSLLTQGVWYLHVKARDNAGNWGSTAHSSAINIDTTVPTNPSIDTCSHPTDGTWVSDTDLSISWSGAGDTGGAGLDGYHYILDTTTNTPVTTSHDFTSSLLFETTLSSDGTYYFHIRAVDNAGNLAGSTIHYGPIKFDNSNPSNPSAFYPDIARYTWTSTRDFFIYWEGFSDGAGSGVEGFNFIWDTISDTTVPTSTDPLDSLINSTNAPDLGQSNNWYIHIRTRDNMGFWASSTAHYGPFYVDIWAPLNPISFFDSPDPNVWTNGGSISLSWDEATDTGGSGVAGYSIVFDTNAGTIPDTSSDTSDPSYSANSIPDGIYYFHIRTVDGVGNVSVSTAHYGPYLFDSTPANNPLESSLICLSGHSITTWNTNTIITIQWDNATDLYSGVAGYSYIFSTNPLDVPDTSIESNSTDDSSGSLGDSNSWYFILRTRDNAGNWNTTTIKIGPFYIDSHTPNNPTLNFYNMTPGVDWHYDHYIEIHWSGASDAAGGSGVYGYAVLWSQTYEERPDEVVTTTETENITFYLDNSLAWYVHIITQDNVGLWSVNTYVVGPWKIDDSEPSFNPTVSCSSHSILSWSATSTIDFTWENAFDAVSGVYGYSYVFDQFSDTVPNTVVNRLLESVSCVVSVSSNDYYFHIISCDNAGNWNMTVITLGPYYVDITKPSNPTTNVTSSPLTYTWSQDDTIYVAWSGDADSHSGVSKYYYHWVSTPSQPSGTYQTPSTSLTSGALGQGTWYFCVRSVDAVNNLADGYFSIGPFLIDKTQPNALLVSQLTANHTLTLWVIGESDHPYIKITWTAGTDVGGSGVAGYSFLWNTLSSSNPDSVVDTIGLESESGLLADSSTGHYFHIRVIDNVGLQSSVFSYGPFKIDTTAPTTVTSLDSNRTNDLWDDKCFSEYIRVSLVGQYGGASDEGSGIDGFAYSFSMNSLDEAPYVKNGEESIVNIISAKLLVTGRYWFHIRAFDNLGKYSATYHFGNWTIDVTPPNNPMSYSSGTHVVGVWDKDTALSVLLIGATDPGRGLYFYHIFMDTNPTASGIPTDANLLTGNTYINSSIGEGSFYIHIMTADRDSVYNPVHWNGTWLTIGPIQIDASNPTNPTSDSPSQSINVWSSSTTITISMVGATDSVSGIAGYSFIWTKNPSTVPDTIVDGTSYVNNSVDEGIYYLNVKTCDEAGNWAPGFYSSGPYKFDFGAPTSSYSLSRSPQPNGWYFGYVDIDFDNETYDVSGLDGLYYRINEGTWVKITNLDQTVRLYDGLHDIEYYLRDNAGNSEITKNFLLQIDTTTPQVTTESITIPNGGQFKYESGTINIIIDLSGEWNIQNVVMRIFNASEMVDTVILTQGTAGEYIATINTEELGYGDFTFDLNVTSTSGRFTFLSDAGSFSIISIPNADILIYIILAVVGGVVAFTVYKAMTRRKPINISGKTSSPQNIKEQEKINAISSALKQQKLTKLITYVEGSQNKPMPSSIEAKNEASVKLKETQPQSETPIEQISEQKPVLKEISRSRIKQITVQNFDNINMKVIYCPACGHKEMIDLKAGSDMKCPKCGQEKGVLFKCPNCQEFYTMTVAETILSETSDIPCPSCKLAVIRPIKEDEI